MHNMQSEVKSKLDKDHFSSIRGPIFMGSLFCYISEDNL